MVTVASANLTLVNVMTEIDGVIQTAFISKLPGYIAIPLDLINAPIEGPSVLPLLELSPPKNPERVQSVVIEQILNATNAAEQPVIIVDVATIRHGLQAEVNEFANSSGFPTFSAKMGKGVIDESLPNYHGVYNGNITLEGIKEEIHKTDLLIKIGSKKSDFNTGNFSYGFENIKKITLNIFSTTIYHADYAGVGMHELLPLLTATLPENKNKIKFSPRVKSAPIDTSDTNITHNYLWNKVPEYIAPNSIVVCETEASGFGISGIDSPKGVIFISQILWASIVYSVGAAVGAAFADRNRKVYLFVGDGSFQLTAPEISVFIRQGHTPIIFLLNNDGYLTEKLIHGPERKYNNIQMWNYSKSLEYFGGDLETNKTKKKNPSKIGLEIKVTTRQGFEDARELANEQPNKIHFLEVVMPEFDTTFELSMFYNSSENR